VGGPCAWRAVTTYSIVVDGRGSLPSSTIAGPWYICPNCCPSEWNSGLGWAAPVLFQHEVQCLRRRQARPRPPGWLGGRRPPSSAERSANSDWRCTLRPDGARFHTCLGARNLRPPQHRSELPREVLCVLDPAIHAVPTARWEAVAASPTRNSGPRRNSSATPISTFHVATPSMFGLSPGRLQQLVLYLCSGRGRNPIWIH